MKELSDYFKLIRKYFWLILALVILVDGGVVIYSQGQEKRYQASATFFVNHPTEPRNERYYTYEGFYAQQLAKEYTDVVVGLLNSSDISRLALSLAQLSSANPKIVTTVKKISPQVINVTVASSSQEDARKMVLALAQVTTAQSKNLFPDQNQGIMVTPVNPEPATGPLALNLALYLAIATLGVVLLGVLFIIVREYLSA